jgi:hypothetical protein
VAIFYLQTTKGAAFSAALMDKGGTLKRRARLNAEFPQNERERAETCKGGLKKIQPDEGREQQPPRAEELGEPEAREDHGASEGHHDSVYSHAARPFDFVRPNEQLAFALTFRPAFFRFCFASHSSAQNNA